jgi:hypothetical protein
MLPVADIAAEDAGPIFPAHPVTGAEGWRRCFCWDRYALATLAGFARPAAG